MARVDVISKDLSGIYLDGIWMPVVNIDMSRQDEPAVYEYEMNGTRFEIQPPRVHWTVTVDVDDKNGIMGTLRIQDPEVFFWNDQLDYRAVHEQYIIQEWP